MRIVFIISFIASITVMGLNSLADGTEAAMSYNNKTAMALEAIK